MPEFSSNDHPNQASLIGWITPTLSSAASQPSSSSLTEALADRNAKRVATPSLEARGFTAKELRVRGDQTNIVGPFASSMKHKLTRLHQNPPTPETAPRHHIASTQDEPDPDSDSDDISSDEDDNGDDADSDDGQSGELDDGFASHGRRLLDEVSRQAHREPRISPGLKANPTTRRHAQAPFGGLGLRSEQQARQLLLDCQPDVQGNSGAAARAVGALHAEERQELLASPEPPSGAQIRSLIDANGVYCKEHGVRLDKLEGRGEVQRRCLGVYWKVALPKGNVDSEDTDYDDIDEQDAEHQYSVHHHPPPPIRIYNGQTAKVIPSGNTMGFRARWREHVREAYCHDEANARDSLFTTTFIKS
ncbi:hypothetical protein I350_04290 [Cryptococcus amylolentus CBS 6273]|uniref:Uncharacterized protein n=1 Tax=Cryptococcus amylolentus CBS 6273 TaxID=1296118 RepID=A0A1E3K1K4_9TREE|nr:hypothetical protein I350_04290 [Cryptococcus amylolentus CBS 6273]